MSMDRVARSVSLAFAALVAGAAVSSAAAPLIRVDWPRDSRRVAEWPVTAGVPFARGAVSSLDRARLVDARGRQVPFQWRALQKWSPEGTIRWASLDFAARPGAGPYRLELAGGGGGAAGGVQVSKQGGGPLVDTGALRAEIPTQGSGGLFRRVWVKGRLVCESSPRDGGYLVDAKGVAYYAGRGARDKVVVERSGPLHTVVRVDGVYRSAKGVARCAYRARLHFYAGKPFVRLQHTFLFTEDDRAFQIRDLGVRVTLKDAPTAALFSRGDAPGDGPVRVAPVARGESLSLLQDKHHHLGQPESHWALTRRAAGTRGH